MGLRCEGLYWLCVVEGVLWVLVFDMFYLLDKVVGRLGSRAKTGHVCLIDVGEGRKQVLHAFDVARVVDACA